MGISAQALRGMAIPAQTGVQADGVIQPDIPSLNALAVRSLASLFDEKEQLFAERVTLDKDGCRRDCPSRQQTIIALLGLHRLAEAGGTQPFDIARIGDVAFKDRSWVKSPGDLGLLTWFSAICRPDELEVALNEIDLETVLTTSEAGRQAQTTSLALFLAGLSHAALARPEMLSGLTDTAVDTYRLLCNNQGHSGIFGHAGSTRFPLGAIRSRFGTFSDQIFAIYALSIFAKAFQIEEPLDSALACANAVCTLQGELGQWWFLYDKNRSRVVKRYPVLSFQQDGAAPCALRALGEVTGRSFDSVICKGLSWMTGANELASDLLKPDQAFICDSIEPVGRLAAYREAVLNFLIPVRGAAANSLGVRFEARAGHFGWLLYAFGEVGLPREASRVARQGGR
jgi:hypothetical protein